ncbi:unnamed protein product [Protopolystoma xenopodis]|uniref:Uncharacterized protein n=1 Tax=Protopolystoma xenopodis TaxID=117903 RepID=A0A3S5AIU7_9PLAT|nr:unnamed protein product [Protopolystoma xenopodis]
MCGEQIRKEKPSIFPPESRKRVSETASTRMFQQSHCLLAASTFESFHQTASFKMEVSSTMTRVVFGSISSECDMWWYFPPADDGRFVLAKRRFALRMHENGGDGSK